MALSSGSGDEETPIRGESIWTHPMAHFLSILMEEGRQMIHELGLPPEMAWRHVGLSEDQIADALAEGFDPENVIVPEIMGLAPGAESETDTPADNQPTSP